MNEKAHDEWEEAVSVYNLYNAGCVFLAVCKFGRRHYQALSGLICHLFQRNIAVYLQHKFIYQHVYISDFSISTYSAHFLI